MASDLTSALTTLAARAEDEAAARSRLTVMMRERPNLGIQLSAEWVQSYLALRGTKARIRAVDVAAYHNTRRTELSRSGSTERRLYGVPKVNWPQGVPRAVGAPLR